MRTTEHSYCITKIGKPLNYSLSYAYGSYLFVCVCVGIHKSMHVMWVVWWCCTCKGKYVLMSWWHTASFNLNLSTNDGKWFTSHPSTFPTTPLWKEPQGPLVAGLVPDPDWKYWLRQIRKSLVPVWNHTMAHSACTPVTVLTMECACVCVYCTRSAFIFFK
jgi:hypothetical protein